MLCCVAVYREGCVILYNDVVLCMYVVLMCVMLCCVELCCVVLCCVVLCRCVLCYVVACCGVLLCFVLCCVLCHIALRCYAVLLCIAVHYMLLCFVAVCCDVLYVGGWRRCVLRYDIVRFGVAYGVVWPVVMGSVVFLCDVLCRRGGGVWRTTC